MMQQGGLQTGKMNYGTNTEHSKGVHRVRYNTTAVAGTIYPDGLGCITIQQQFAQHVLGCTGMHHTLACTQYVPTISEIHKPPTEFNSSCSTHHRGVCGTWYTKKHRGEYHTGAMQ